MKANWFGVSLTVLTAVLATPNDAKADLNKLPERMQHETSRCFLTSYSPKTFETCIGQTIENCLDTFDNMPNPRICTVNAATATRAHIQSQLEGSPQKIEAWGDIQRASQRVCGLASQGSQLPGLALDHCSMAALLLGYQMLNLPADFRF